MDLAFELVGAPPALFLGVLERSADPTDIALGPTDETPMFDSE